jgi:hypothetical protein
MRKGVKKIVRLDAFGRKYTYYSSVNDEHGSKLHTGSKGVDRNPGTGKGLSKRPDNGTAGGQTGVDDEIAVCRL